MPWPRCGAGAPAPLGIEGRCLRRLDRRAILLEAGPLVSRSLARLAHRAPGYDGEPELTEWIDACIDRAIEDLLAASAERETRGRPELEPTDPTHHLLARLLGIEAPLARRSALVFNHLPVETRRIFWSVVVQGKTIPRTAAEGLGDREVIRSQLTFALRRLGTPGRDPSPPPGPPSRE